MEAEKILLGQMLIDNRIAIDVRLSGDEFLSPENKQIFKGLNKYSRKQQLESTYINTIFYYGK